MSLVSIAKISRLEQASVPAQDGLCLAWSETPEESCRGSYDKMVSENNFSLSVFVIYAYHVLFAYLPFITYKWYMKIILWKISFCEMSMIWKLTHRNTHIDKTNSPKRCTVYN